MDTQSVTDIQDAIVSEVMSSITTNWQYALVDIEIDIVDGEQTENCLMLVFSRANNAWMSHSGHLPYTCYDLFVDLRNQMATTKAFTKWSNCTLEIDSQGKYRYSFSYNPPRRLAGQHDKDSMFEDYEPQVL